jgi:hypothetical protein
MTHFKVARLHVARIVPNRSQTPLTPHEILLLRLHARLARTRSPNQPRPDHIILHWLLLITIMLETERLSFHSVRVGNSSSLPLDRLDAAGIAVGTLVWLPHASTAYAPKCYEIAQ